MPANPEDLDLSRCTHAIFGFARIHPLMLVVVPANSNDMSSATDRGLYERFNRNKLRHPNLKTLLALQYPTMLTGLQRFRRADFIKSIVGYLRENDFDGIDLHVEDIRAWRQDEIIFVQELKEQFVREFFAQSPRERLLLVLSVPADEIAQFRGSFQALAAAVDFIQLTPTEVRKASAMPTEDLTSTLLMLSSSGVSLGQLVPGVAFYGPISGQNHLATYSEICRSDQAVSMGKAQEAIQEKISTVVASTSIPNIALWTVNVDDAQGRCGSGRYPLTHLAAGLLPRGCRKTRQAPSKMKKCFFCKRITRGMTPPQ